MKQNFLLRGAVALAAIATLSAAQATVFYGANVARTWGSSDTVQYDNSNNNLNGYITDNQSDSLYVYWKGNQLFNDWNNSGIAGSRPANLQTREYKNINLPYTIYNLRLYRSDGTSADIF